MTKKGEIQLFLGCCFYPGQPKTNATWTMSKMSIMKSWFTSACVL